MYIFASPIQYKTSSGYSIINNTLIASKRENFAFENKANHVKTYFPKKLSGPFRVEKDADTLSFWPDFDISGFSKAEQIVFTNMYGDDVSAALYSRNDIDLIFYPTKAGIKSEVVLKEKPKNNGFAFSICSGASTFDNDQNGYIVFKKEGGQNESLIYQPLVQSIVDGKRQLDVTARMNMERREEDYHVNIKISEEFIDSADIGYPIKFDPSFEMYLQKIPDSTAYSKCNINNYLCHYAVIGEHSVLGDGWYYTRLRLNYFMRVNIKNIKSAVYVIKPLWRNKDVPDLQAYEPIEQWSSTGLLWENKSKPRKQISKAELQNKYLEFKANLFISECFCDLNWQKESIGFLIKTDQKDTFNILATADNSLYTPYIKINLDMLPMYFDPRQNVNETH